MFGIMKSRKIIILLNCVKDRVIFKYVSMSVTVDVYN